MTCERCTDIHKAQKEGKTQRECGCNCHYNSTFTTGTTFTLTGNTCDTGETSSIGLISTDTTGNTVAP